MPDETTATPVGRFEWERAVRGLRTVKPAALTFGYVLASYANRDGTRIRVGQRALVEATGYSEESVSAYLKALRTAGLIERVSRGSVAARRAAADEHRLTVPTHLAPAQPPRTEAGVVGTQPPPESSGVVGAQPPPESSATTPGSVGRPPPHRRGGNQLKTRSRPAAAAVRRPSEQGRTTRRRPRAGASRRRDRGRDRVHSTPGPRRRHRAAR